MTPDPQSVIREQAKTWNACAPGWNRYDDFLRRAMEPVSRGLLELAGLKEGHRVLDIASGTGEPGLPAAELVGPSGKVVLTDIAEKMLEVAREKARARGLENVEFRAVDGARLDAGEAEFDAAICRFGVMFMPEPDECAASVYRILKSGGRFAFSTWGPPEENPFLSIPIKVLAGHVDFTPPPPGAPGPFAFADPDRAERLLSNAGFKDVAVEKVEVTAADFDSGHDFWQYTLDMAGPIANLFDQVPGDRQQQVAEEIAATAAGGDPNNRVVLKGNALLAAGTK